MALRAASVLAAQSWKVPGRECPLCPLQVQCPSSCSHSGWRVVPHQLLLGTLWWAHSFSVTVSLSLFPHAGLRRCLCALAVLWHLSVRPMLLQQRWRSPLPCPWLGVENTGPGVVSGWPWCARQSPSCLLLSLWDLSLPGVVRQLMEQVPCDRPCPWGPHTPCQPL